MTNYIYKYFRFDKYFENSLKESYLWFSNASSFNDPFEFQIQGSKELTDQEILEYYHLMKTLDGNRIDKALQGHIKAFIFSFRLDPEKFLDYYLVPFRNRINKFGICCFSKKYDETLMWSHYSDSHRGVVIKFNKDRLDNSIRSDNESVNMTVIDSVKYTDKFPLLKLSRHLSKTANSIKEIIYTKSDNWKYEEEIRMLSNVLGKNYFNIYCIEEIILGTNILKENEDKMKKIINSDPSMSHIKISKMAINNREFKLEKKYI